MLVEKRSFSPVSWFRSTDLFRWMLLGGLLLIAIPTHAFQATSEGARVFPKGASVYVEISHPEDVIELVVGHPLRTQIAELGPVQLGLNSPQMKMARLGLSFLQLRIGEDLLPAVKKLTRGGIYLGVDVDKQAVGLAFKSSDPDLLKKTAGEILGFVRQQGGENVYQIKTYRDGKLALMKGLVLARYGNWFLLANQESYIRSMADNLVESEKVSTPSKTSLASSTPFLEAAKYRNGQSAIWTFVDLASVRKMPNTNPLFQGTTDNPAVELLFGGVLEGLENARFLGAGLQLDDKSVRLSLSLPFSKKGIRESREFYFGNQAMGQAPPSVEVPGVMGQVTTYRDLGRWWLAKEDLFSEKVIANLSLAESQLSTFFGNADFGEEILGALQPGLRLVVKPQEYKEGVDPDIKLPAFALIGRLQNPQRETRFRISFNSFITLLNLSENGSMPQFDVQTMKEQGYRVTSAQYLIDDAEDTGLIHYNFSPSIAFQDDYMILASTEDLACELAAATKAWDPEATSASNSLLSVSISELKKQLNLNRESLIAQSMVENNKSREVATEEIDILFAIMDFANRAVIDYQVKDREMTLDITLDLNHGH